MIEEFNLKPFFPSGYGSKNSKPSQVIPDHSEEETTKEIAGGLVSDTAALSGFTKIFKHEDVTLCSIVDADGEIWFKGRELAAALGYRHASSAISRHIDQEWRMKFKELSFKCAAAAHTDFLPMGPAGGDLGHKAWGHTIAP